MSRAFVLLRAAVFAALFVSLWTWFIPRWIAGGDLHPRWGWLPVTLMTIGAAVMIRCVWDFAWTGRGTPMPLDPPRKLVITGLYAHVRNPMYLGMAIFLFGEALLLPVIRLGMLLVIAGAWFVVNGFILLYEEPKLRDLFGDVYIEYCRHVNRWLPRATPWSNKPEPTLFDNTQNRA
jgi:protein-S-isoprenylcysteine O-methyltransferase Ste14